METSEVSREFCKEKMQSDHDLSHVFTGERKQISVVITATAIVESLGLYDFEHGTGQHLQAQQNSVQEDG
jgi:hypothetical protein